MNTRPFVLMRKMMPLAVIVISTMLILVCSAWGERFNIQAANISYCHDGDTCTAYTTDGSKLKIRFFGIDAPELKQLGGIESRNYLESLIKGKMVSLQCKGRSFKRLTCDLFMNHLDIQQQMVEVGWAWDYFEFSRGKYQSAMKKAREQGLGVWALPDHTSPYCYRWPDKKPCYENTSFQP